jgi:hypothetical protein
MTHSDGQLRFGDEPEQVAPDWSEVVYALASQHTAWSAHTTAAAKYSWEPWWPTPAQSALKQTWKPAAHTCPKCGGCQELRLVGTILYQYPPPDKWAEEKKTTWWCPGCDA